MPGKTYDNVIQEPRSAKWPQYARAPIALAPALIALAPSAAPEIEALTPGAALWRPALRCGAAASAGAGAGAGARGAH